MYQNENYGTKWFYAYITNMRYVNDNMTEINIATDVWQTWQFDLNFKRSFIEREMLSTSEDIPGANLVPEGLETGEFKVSNSYSFQELEPVAVVAYTRNPSTDDLTDLIIPPDQQGVIVNGIPNGMFLMVSSINRLQSGLELINGHGHGDAIMTVFTIPALAVIGLYNWSLNDLTRGNGVREWIINTFKANPITKTLNAVNSLDGYTPRNKKLLTYPYCYLGFNPSNGSSKIYRYEDFTNGTPVFKLISEINQNPLVCFIPQNYRGKNGNSLQDVSNMQGYPTLGWITEYFNTWLAQNGNIIGLQVNQEQYNYESNQIQKSLNSSSNIATNAFSGNVSGVINESINMPLELTRADVNHEYYIKNQLAQIEKQQMLPNQGHLSGSNATLLGYDLLDNDIFTAYTIKAQFAQRIDQFFDMYGYLTNKVKIPNLNNRPIWNYVKTIGANITGNIPQMDLQIIKDMFNNGVTLWHSPNTFLDYSQNNR